MNSDRKTSHGAGVYSIENADGSRTFFARVQYQGREFSEACASSSTPTEEARALRAARDRVGALRDEIRRSRQQGAEWLPPREREKQKLEAKAGPTTVKAFSRRFLEDWVGKKRSREFYTYRVAAINAKLGATPLARLTLAQCQRFYTQRVAETSVSTANHDLRVLTIMLRRAVEWGYLRENVATRVSREKTPEQAERFLYREEAERLIEASPPWLRAIVEVALQTGMRQGEILGLAWTDHVDLGRRIIRLEGTDTKGKRARVVPINQDLEALLRALPRSTRTDHVFHRDGRPVTKDALKRTWMATLKRAGVPEFRFHDLRHTAASWMVMQGVPLYEVQKILGHSTIRLTERYAHLAPDHLRGAVQALEGYRGPSRGAAGKA